LYIYWCRFRGWIWAKRILNMSIRDKCWKEKRRRRKLPIELT